MSLLREIQDSAIDSKTDLASLLRKCKVLAARLGSTEFRAWVDSELSGYKNIEDLPDYRILYVNSKGHFSGAFNSGLKNADIPLLCIPEKFRETMSRSNMMQPVASIESLVSSSDGENCQEPWNPDFVAMVGTNIYKGMNCMQAWKVIPITALISALDEIRNRILNFVIEIESEDPTAGEARINSATVPPEKVHQIFNTYISGSVQNVSAGGKDFQQNATYNANNDELFNALIAALENLKEHKEFAEVRVEIDGMRATQGSERFKDHYCNFMSILSDHMQVLGPVVAPFLPALSKLLS